MKTHSEYTRLTFVAFCRRVIHDFRDADMHSTADDYETALQFIADDVLVMIDARKALLAATAHTPTGSNASTLCHAAIAKLDEILDAPTETPSAPALSLSEKIAASLLTPHGGPEGTRLAIKLKRGDGTEDDLGGNNKQSVIDTVNRVLVTHEAESKPRARRCLEDVSHLRD